MFEIPDIDLEYSLSVLAIEKTLYNHTGKIINTFIDYDYLFEAQIYAIDLISDCIVRSYNEYEEIEIDKIQFPSMQEFYNLCREYGKKRHISFKQNPYVKKAEDYVNSEMRNIESYSISWSLFTPKKITEKKWPCLVIFTSPEFYQYVQLVVALFNIRDYFIRSVEELKKDLEIHKGENIQIVPEKIQ